MREEEFRRKIVWFTFWFSLLVVWTHSFNAELFMGRTSAGDQIYRIEKLFGDLAAQIAVPGFFMISGYLFYRNFTWKKLGSKWRSRVRSVLVPYCLWNALYYLAYVAGSHIPGMEKLVGKGEIPFTISNLLDAVVNHTYLYVFWYLYQLILLIALAPALYLALKRTWTGGIYFAVLLLALWFGVDFPLLNEDALFYYSAAAFFGLRSREGFAAGVLEAEWSKGRRTAGILLMGAALLSLYLSGQVWRPFYVVMYRFLMVAGLWMAVSEKRLGEPRPWMEYSFFLYATHFAWVRLINKGAAAVFYRAAWEGAGRAPELWPAGLAPLLLFLAMPFLMAGISFQTGRLLKRIFPELYGWLTGGR